MSSESISKTQIKGFIAAWLGWAFDGMDSLIYTLVAGPFVLILLGAGATKADAGPKAALIQAVFMFGWAIGGAFFGRIGDRIGRTKTLTLTILIYATFTGLSAVSTEWWHLMIFRFISALGIGGEWAAGSALVSETLHKKHRWWASATLQTGYNVGMILASLTVAFLPGYLLAHGYEKGMVYRAVFLVGVLPAFFTLWIRKAVPEPEEWHAARAGEELPKVSDLFSPEVRATTIKILVFLSVALTCVWTFIFFSTQVIRGLDEVKSMPTAAVEKLVGQSTIIYLLWNIVGNYAATYMARKAGVRLTFCVFLFASLCFGWFGFNHVRTLSDTLFYINGMAFFSLGVFGIFPLYIPPLFPVLLRTTGSGFCYNFGRVIAGIGTLYGGSLVGKYGAAKPIAYISLLFIAGIAMALVMPESVERQEELDAAA